MGMYMYIWVCSLSRKVDVKSRNVYGGNVVSRV